MGRRICNTRTMCWEIYYVHQQYGCKLGYARRQQSAWLLQLFAVAKICGQKYRVGQKTKLFFISFVTQEKNSPVFWPTRYIRQTETEIDQDRITENNGHLAALTNKITKQ